MIESIVAHYNLVVDYNSSPKGRFRKLKHLAKTKDIVLDISVEEYAEIIESNQCHYCKDELDSKGYNLDRKNPRVGYTIANVVPCCGHCNFIKSDKLSYKEMIVLSAT